MEASRFNDSSINGADGLRLRAIFLCKFCNAIKDRFNTIGQTNGNSFAAFDLGNFSSYGEAFCQQRDDSLIQRINFGSQLRQRLVHFSTFLSAASG